MDQREFLRQMEELVDFGRTKENLLTKQEIADYCSDWNLTEEQMPFVYAYLKEHRIEVEGYRAPVEKTEEEAVEKSGKFTWSQPVEIHQQKSHCRNHCPVPQHVERMVHPLKHE